MNTDQTHTDQIQSKFAEPDKCELEMNGIERKSETGAQH